MLAIMKQMYSDWIILDQQKHGTIVCPPKTPGPTRPEDYRPLTLLNADLKLMARIIATRLRPWLVDLLQSSQHCVEQGNTILEAITAVGDAMAYAETKNTALCILLLFFVAAFDSSHSYLLNMLRSCGFSERFQQRIKSMYEGATSSVHINGHISSPTPTRCSIG